jgi:hypothetical protein
VWQEIPTHAANPPPKKDLLPPKGGRSDLPNDHTEDNREDERLGGERKVGRLECNDLMAARE